MSESDPITRGPETASSAASSSVEEQRPGVGDRLRAFLRRPAVRAGTIGLAVGAVIAAGVPVAIVTPYVSDDVALDRIVRAVALDWRDFGEPKARERLEYELDHQRIGPQVKDGDCDLGRDGAERLVACSWTVSVAVPGTDFVWPLSFSSVARIDASGELR